MKFDIDRLIGIILFSSAYSITGDGSTDDPGLSLLDKNSAT
jgi:hypothetical protein